MKVCYNKLWKLLIDKGMKKSQLRVAVGASKSTFAKLGKNEKVRETRVFCFCDVNSRSDPYGKKTVDTAFSVSAPTAAVAEEKMLLFENASGQKPLRRHYIR